ncbi:hypothetical protein [Legionella micdadei]|uniref:Cofactor-independent phosphoglycerate mutase n=1 Tax=Legionella micdadei TaxID=451 RepID=A0A098GEH0_LEGMI|nr:hypothetical protein [Legionella micdadei]ARG97557.1 hypothetical protein B6N58_07705 [Legionella micdadei]ARH00130.1 hypothetical protein B6V88_06720 [Legionella micdadei]KTD27636.1 hypothetical protein Lmic_1956 [Legionella micdadei]NSL17619.1 hypothetical protein [Legionella micdadei]CEG60878.1 conserved protein of unknown function [Legionella micdadei]
MDVIINDVKDDFPSGSEPLQSQEDYYLNILIGLGYKPGNLPLAPLLAAYHQLPGRWVIASPIHWEATHNDAMIIASGKELELTENESLRWFSEVTQFLHADHFQCFFQDPQKWLFNIDNKPKITSCSIQSVLHRSMMPILNRLDESFYWQRLITELQMYLSSHPLNKMREGKLSINGLWFWGEGELAVPTKRPIATDDEILLKLGLPISPLTPTMSLKQDHLLIINDVKQIEFCNLEDKMRKNKIHWYWNNLAYSSPATHWWSRLWR